MENFIILNLEEESLKRIEISSQLNLMYSNLEIDVEKDHYNGIAMDNLNKRIDLQWMTDIQRLSGNEIINIIIRDFSNYIYSIIKKKFKSSRISDEDVEDCFIELIIKIIDNGCRKIRQFRGESSFKTYLTVVCMNIITDYIRKEVMKSERIKHIDDYSNGNAIKSIDSENYIDEDPEIQYLTKEREKFIKKAYRIIEKEINKLAYDERLLISLKLKRDMTYREMDEFLGIENSRYRLSKAIQKIRDAVDINTRNLIEELLTEDIDG